MNITGGKFNGRKLKTVSSKNVRPTSSKVRAAVFNVLLSLGALENKNFLDLFAGSGIMGIEAVSRGALSATFVEKNPLVFKLIKENLTKFDGEFECFNNDALRFVEKTQQNFDVIFLDPPYFEGFYDKVIEKIKSLKILSKDGLLVIEAPLEVELPEYLNIIKEKIYGTTKVYFANLG